MAIRCDCYGQQEDAMADITTPALTTLRRKGVQA